MTLDPQRILRIALAMFALALIAVAVLVGQGCAGGPTVDVDWSRAVTLSGDLQCRGSGEMRLMQFLTIGAEGGAALEGETDVAGEGSGAVCAGLTLYLGQWRWSWTSALQESAACDAQAGELRVERVTRE